MNGAPAHPGYGATVVALAAGQLLCWAALYYAFTSIVGPMQRELGLGQPWLMGAFTLALALSGPFSYAVGAAIDRGHGRAVLAGGAALGGLALLAWAQVQGPLSLLAAFALLGPAMAATLYDPAFAVLTQRYPLRYPQAITALTLVAGFASTLSLPACAALNQALGWRGALQVQGWVLLLAVVPLHLWALRGPLQVAAPAAGAGPAAADATLHQALRQRSFWLLAACFTLWAFISAAFWAHAMPVFAHKGLDEVAAAAVLVWVGPAQVAGRLAQATFGRGWPLRRLGAVVLTALPLALALLAVGHTVWAFGLFALLFGLANGLITIVRGGLVPQYWARAHVGRIGGAMSAVGLLARAVAPLAAAGWLLWLPGYGALLWGLAGLGVLAVLAFWLARPPPAAPG